MYKDYTRPIQINEHATLVTGVCNHLSISAKHGKLETARLQKDVFGLPRRMLGTDWPRQLMEALDGRHLHGKQVYHTLGSLHFKSSFPLNQ